MFGFVGLEVGKQRGGVVMQYLVSKGQKALAAASVLMLLGMSFAAEGDFAFTGTEFAGSSAAMNGVLIVAGTIIIALVGVRLLRRGGAQVH